MSTSILRLTELPIETLEQILLCLPGQDVIKMEAVSRRFRGLTRNSPTLLHKRDLFSAGLVESPCSPDDFSERRRLYGEHKHKWSNVGMVVKVVHELPEELSIQRRYTTLHGGNLFASHKSHENNLHFLRIPPATSRESIEWWSIPPLPFHLRAFVVYPTNGILAVAEEKERFVCIHFLNLLDGSPHSEPHSNIMWEFPYETNHIVMEELAITGSRIMMRLCYWEDQKDARRVVMWDWKTGDLVLDHLSSRNKRPFGREDITVTFLDEFRVISLAPSTSPIPEFTIFDTLVPHNHQARSRRFCVPPRYHDWFPVLYVDGDRCLGTLDRPLTTDPTQAVLVIKLVSPDGPRVLLIVQIQALIECVHSMSPDTCVPWEEWGRGAAVMDVPGWASAYEGPFPLVQGVHVTWVNATPGVDGLHRPHLCSFDLSRRGRSMLPLRDEGNGTERRVAFEDGRQILLQGNEGMVESQFDPLGDGKFMFFDNYTSPGVELHVWELV